MVLKAVPFTCFKGVTTVVISFYLDFISGNLFYFESSEYSFPSESKEALGHVVSISKNCE
jgi:hypothetical protein